MGTVIEYLALPSLSKMRGDGRCNVEIERMGTGLKNPGFEFCLSDFFTAFASIYSSAKWGNNILLCGIFFLSFNMFSSYDSFSHSLREETPLLSLFLLVS